VPYFSIIADEVTDSCGNQEILSFCLTFLDDNLTKPKIKEVFIDFCYLQRTTGHAVANALFDLLKKHGLNIQNVRGLSFDGASSMSGERFGAQAIIRMKNPLALYTHCRSHVLNLAIAHSCSIQVLRNMIDVINEIYLFFHLSPKRQRFLELVLDAFALETCVKKLKGLCKTRWTERHDCLEWFNSLYEYIYTSLHAIVEPDEYPKVIEAVPNKEKWSWDMSTITKAEGLKTSLKAGNNIIS